LQEAYPAVRLSAEANVALTFVSEAACQVVESRMDDLCRSRPLSALCQYDARGTSGPELPLAVETHPDAVRDENVRLYREGARLHVDGEVDGGSAALVEAYLEQVCRLERSVWLTIDLSRLTFPDVEGCRALIVGTRRLRDDGANLFLERARPHVLRPMTLLGVERQNHVFLG
jgi:anti-anti-sigma factor